jgi:polysaccharide export outer membrane protein
MKNISCALNGCYGFPRFAWATLLLSALLLGGGCAGPSLSQSRAQLVARIQENNQKNLLQDKLMAQMNRTMLTDYKDYAVGPEDLLTVTFFGLNNLNREVRVNGRGEITMPLVGVVQVAGLSPPEIETRLVQLYQQGDYILHPQISVFVKDHRHQRVMVTGNVMNPGAYELIGPRTLLEMLGKAGGLTDKAGDVVHVIRSQSAPDVSKALTMKPRQSFTPGSETIVIDLQRLLVKGDMNLNIPIKNGDVIYVPTAKSAYVLGAVGKPGSVPAKQNLTVTKAISLAGGLNETLSSKKVTIVRCDASGQPTTVNIDLSQLLAGKAPDVPVKGNDIVFVHESLFRRFLYNFKTLMPGSVGYSIPAY